MAIAALKSGALKTKLIGGAWAAVGGGVAVYTYQYIRDFEEQVPCLREAEALLTSSAATHAALGAGELSMARWSRNRSTDLAAGLARASFEVRGSQGSAHVVMGARRRAKEQEAWQAAADEAADEEEERGTGWRRYWARPWELKLLVLGKLQGVRSLWSREGAGADDAPAREEGEDAWELETLFFLPKGSQEPTVLLGQAASLPEYEAVCLRRDLEAKSETSQWRLKVLLGIASAATLVAGGTRFVKLVNVSKSYGYVKNALVAHSEVCRALGSGARLQSSSGTFGAAYINARLRLVGAQGQAADVDVAALREGGRSAPWRVVLARMHTGGLTHNLDKSQF